MRVSLLGIVVVVVAGIVAVSCAPAGGIGQATIGSAPQSASNAPTTPAAGPEGGGGGGTTTTNAGGGTTANTDTGGGDGVIHPKGGNLTEIRIIPSETAVQVGSTVQFTATGVDILGNPATVGDVHWAVVPGAGGMDQTGTLTAQSPGTYKDGVTASNGTIIGFATVTVTR